MTPSGPSQAAELRRLDAATAHLEAPFAIVDMAAFRANAAAMVSRAAGKPIRLASKSVRCQHLIGAALGMTGFRGVLGGGYPASGPGTASRVPSPCRPAGLRLDKEEGAGEVQTPVLGPAADDLKIGDRVWFRHAKAGELCERFAELHLVDRDVVVAAVPTYRGEGRAFA